MGFFHWLITLITGIFGHTCTTHEQFHGPICVQQKCHNAAWPAMFIKRKRQHQERLLKSVKVSKKISNQSTIREIIRSFGNDFPSKPITQLDPGQSSAPQSSTVPVVRRTARHPETAGCPGPARGWRIGQYSIEMTLFSLLKVHDLRKKRLLGIISCTR